MSVDPALCIRILQELENGWSRRFPTRGSFRSRTVGNDQIKTRAYVAKEYGKSDEAREAYTTSWDLLPACCKGD